LSTSVSKFLIVEFLNVLCCHGIRSLAVFSADLRRGKSRVVNGETVRSTHGGLSVCGDGVNGGILATLITTTSSNCLRGNGGGRIGDMCHPDKSAAGKGRFFN